MRTQKATHEQLRRHNRQLLLRAVYSELANNRAALAQATGLAKPTVSNLISELIDEGLLVETGHGHSTESGGKRPRLIEFMPDARQVIGVSVEHERILGVLSNLAGMITAHHHVELAPGEDPALRIQDVINGLIAQLDAPLLCIGAGVPGAVEAHAGATHHSEPRDSRRDALADRLAQHYDVPAYIGNSAELCALAQFSFGTDSRHTPRNLVTIMVNDKIEVGVTLDGGAFHYGGDISCLYVTYDKETTAVSNRLVHFLSWHHTQQRVAELRERYPDTLLPKEGLTYMHLRYGTARGDRASLELTDELAANLAKVTAWAIALLHPDQVSLAGPIASLGEPFLTVLGRKTEVLLTPDLLAPVSFSLAYSDNLSAIGAVALALQKELALL